MRGDGPAPSPATTSTWPICSGRHQPCVLRWRSYIRHQEHCMNIRLVSIASLALAVATLPADAQRPTATVARVTPYVGYMQFGNYVDGPLGTSVRNAGAPLYGVQLG